MWYNRFQFLIGNLVTAKQIAETKAKPKFQFLIGNLVTLSKEFFSIGQLRFNSL